MSAVQPSRRFPSRCRVIHGCATRNEGQCCQSCRQKPTRLRIPAHMAFSSHGAISTNCYSARRFDADRRANLLRSRDSGGHISAPNNRPPLRAASVASSPTLGTRGRERSCLDDAVAASGVKGERYKAARAQPNPAPSRFKGANTGRCPMIECCEPATKIRTNLPWACRRVNQWESCRRSANFAWKCPTDEPARRQR